MRDLRPWSAYLSAGTRARLSGLAISDRPDHEGAPAFADVCLKAQEAADSGQCAVVVGWQINDATGDKEPGYGPAASLNLLCLEPVAMLYPIERDATCKPKKS